MNIFTGWRQFLNEAREFDEKLVRAAILDVIPHAVIGTARTVSDHALGDGQVKAHFHAREGFVEHPQDIEIEVEIEEASKQDLERWRESSQARYLSQQHHYDVRLRSSEPQHGDSKVTKVRIFDFDDTLALTKERVHVRDKTTNEIIKTLQSQEELDEFTSIPEEERKEYFIDFEEFSNVYEPEEVQEITQILKDVVGAEERDPHRAILILTARNQDSEKSIRKFLHDIGITSAAQRLITVVGVGESTDEEIDTFPRKSGGQTLPSSELKAQEIRNLLEEHPLVREVLFFDDSQPNISAVAKLREEYPNIKFVLKKITHTSDALRVRSEAVKGDGEYQALATADRQKNNHRLLDLGSNTTKPKKWTFRRKGTTESAPPGALEESRAISPQKGVVIAIFGPSACGKTELKKRILNSYPFFDEIKSTSTRRPRELAGAVDAERDREYNFIEVGGVGGFFDKVKQDELVNVNNYGGNWYGTERGALERMKNSVILTDLSSVEPLHRTLQQMGKQVAFVYCDPPPVNDLLRRHRDRKDYVGYDVMGRINMALEEIEAHEKEVPKLESRVPIYYRDEIFGLLDSIKGAQHGSKL